MSDTSEALENVRLHLKDLQGEHELLANDMKRFGAINSETFDRFQSCVEGLARATKELSEFSFKS